MLEDKELLLLCSPVLDIDGIEAVIVHLNKHESKYFEQVDIQMPGYHLLNRVGFEDEEMRDAYSYIDRHIDLIWALARENSNA